MFWSTEDRTRQIQQQNFYNNYQIVQHTNGIPQATAAVPASQHPTPPPPQQPPQHQPQQQHHHQQQHQHHSSHRAAQMQIPSAHYAAGQQMQPLQLPHPQQQHQQWTSARGTPVLTAPPFLKQYSTSVPTSTQYCNAPAPTQFYHPNQRITQASAVSAPSQQRPCLPPGCAMFPMPPQAAAALRQNVISQPPPGIITPATTTAAQQIQLQYYSVPPYCQPPNYSHVMAPAIPEAPVVKTRRHAIPIIDPTTKENVLERDFRRSESASPAEVISIAATSPATTTNLKESKNDDTIPVTSTATYNELLENDTHNEVNKNIKLEEDMTDSSVLLPEAVVDHVDSIEAKNEVEEKEKEISTATEQIVDVDVEVDEAHGITKSISGSTTTINASVALEIENDVESVSAGKECNHQKTLSQSADEKNLPPSTEAKKQSIESPTAVTKVNKQQPPPQPSPTAIAKKTQPNKKGKKNKRPKESQKKQKAELLNNESNNNTNKISNQNQNTVKQIFSEPYNRLTAKAKECSDHSNISSVVKTEDVTPDVTAIKVEGEDSDDVMKLSATLSLDDHDKYDESSEKLDDENDQSSQIYDSPKLTKSEQIASEILGVESTDGNELLFLNSSMSGFEEDICSSPLDDTLEKDVAQDIHFGDFSQENLTQELSSPLDTEAEHPYVDASQQGEKKYAYTLQTLKSLASEPASKIPPAFRGKICESIGKNPGALAGASSQMQMQQSNQQNHMFQQMSYKDTMNSLNRKRSKRMNEMQQPHQQFQQQYDQQKKPDMMIRINLSLNEEIQLAKSENAWVPAGLSNCAPPSESDEDEKILKKVRGILNKLTPENFDKLLKSATNFPITGEERIRKVMLLIFEKTVSEPDFAPTYACFCKFLFNAKKQNCAGFDTILIKRIQDEFEGNVNNAKAKNAKLKPIMDRLAAATDPKEKAEIKAELDEQEYQFRRRAWGTVRFIGEMFKLGFIKTNRVCLCVEDLFDPQCEEKLEYMCKLLTTVGPQLEPIGKQMNEDKFKISDRLDVTFKKIRQLVEKKKASAHVSSRVRFMMQDVLELRSRSWDQKPSGPPVMLHSREVSPAITRAPSYSSQQRDRAGPSRVANNNYMTSAGGYEKRRQTGDDQKKPLQQNIDMNKLMPIFNNDVKDDTTRKLGGFSMDKWQKPGRTQGQQQLGPAIQQVSRQQSRSLQSTPPPREELSSKECGRLLNHLIGLVLEEPKKEWFAKWEKINPADHPTIIYQLFADYLPSQKKQCAELDACTRLFTSLLKEDLLTRSAFNDGYQKFVEICEEILLDVPKVWQYLFYFIGPLLHLELIPFELIWDNRWYNSSVGDKFLQNMIKYFTSEFGANYMRFFWEDKSLRWDKFIGEERVASFVTSNCFDFIDSDKCLPPIFVQRSDEELVQHIESLLAKSGQVVDLVIDFISTNVHIDCSFVRILTMFLCDYTVIDYNTQNNSSISSKKSKLFTGNTSSVYKLREGVFVTNCIPLLRRCIDSKDEHELSCLDAIVARCNQRYGPSADNLICAMFTELDGEIISRESFEKWHQQQQLRDDNNLTNDLNEFFKNIPI